MLFSRIRIALRHFRKNPIYTGLNIVGLAVGVACFLLIVLQVENETGYERALPGAERVFRVTTDVRLNSGQKKFYALSTSGLAGALKAEYPEVEQSTKILPFGGILLRNGDTAFFERSFTAVDPNFLGVFPYPLAAGDPATALERPNSLLLTREMAVKYFGSENPIGRTITADNQTAFTVTGVMDKPRGPSHLRTDFIARFANAPFFNHPTWTALGIYTYIKLKETASPADFEAKIQDLATKYVGAEGKRLFRYRLQPITSIHLRSDREADFAAVVGVTQVRLLLVVAVLILLVACVNFVTLSTARAARRAREVGIRKTLGARRAGLFRQFLNESFVSTFAAFGLGLGLAAAALPWFNSLWGASLSLSPAKHVPFLFFLAVIVGLLAGSYPAFVLSSFRPALALKGLRGKGKASALPRKALIVFQYSAAIVLLISAGVVAAQMNFLRTKNLGFDRDRILSVHLRSPEVISGYEGIKQEFLRNPDIAAATAVSAPLGLQAGTLPYIPEGFDDNSILVRTLFVDHDFLEAMGMKIVAGREFRRDFPTDAKTAYLINRTAQTRFGWTDPLGKTITCIQRDEPPELAAGQVIGVVEDFHVRSLRDEIEPVILRIRPDAFQFLFLKLRGGNVERTTAFIESKMAELQPLFPPETFFLDAALDERYDNESRLGRIFRTFSLLTVLVACVGLLGLVAYDAEQRTKEIGIRKVLGAPNAKILWLFIRESAGLVLLANVVAWPVGYLLMADWLRNFAYRTVLPPAVLLVSGASVLAVALMAISFQAYRAASADPVKSIRYE